TRTNQQIRRTIRPGPSRDGRRLFPVMPYLYYHHMSDGDLDAIVLYLRTLTPIRNAVPPSAYPPPVAAMLKSMPEPPEESVQEPDRSSRIAYGKYLTTLGTCGNCHTPLRPDGSQVPRMECAGGFLLKGPWGQVTSTNLTPDPSGIPHYTDELFLQVLKTGNIGGRRLNAIMPWGYYHGMKDEDILAIRAYLRTLAPVSHRVDNTSPSKPCVKCGGNHGLGDLNR